MQSEKAEDVIERLLSEHEMILIQPIVLCELVWVLRSAYGHKKRDILKVLDFIMETAQFDITEKDILWHALDDYRNMSGDYSDYYIGRANEKAGADVTLTFDKGLRNSKSFKVIS